jgi:hypothetical protein
MVMLCILFPARSLSSEDITGGTCQKMTANIPYRENSKTYLSKKNMNT